MNRGSVLGDTTMAVEVRYPAGEAKAAVFMAYSVENSGAQRFCITATAQVRWRDSSIASKREYVYPPTLTTSEGFFVERIAQGEYDVHVPTYDSTKIVRVKASNGI
jgi:hypothetical protein